MIGTLNLNSAYKVITTEQQLENVVEALQSGDLERTTLIVDAALQSDGRTTASRLFHYLCMVARRLELRIIVVGGQASQFSGMVSLFRDCDVEIGDAPIQIRVVGSGVYFWPCQ